jgi:hypothetical protein
VYKSKLDRQVEATHMKPPRHPFVTLSRFVLILFVLGAAGFSVATLKNAVPAAGNVPTPASALPAATHATPLPRGELPAGVSAAPTLSPGSVRPEQWTVTMREATIDGKTWRWGEVADPRVTSMVWTDLLEAYHWLFDSGWHPDYQSEVERYFTNGKAGQADDVNLAEGIRQLLAKQEASGAFAQVVRLNYSANHEVFSFSPDGLSAQVRVWEGQGRSQMWQSGGQHKLLSDSLIDAYKAPTVYTLIYDRVEKRWKVNQIEYLE